MCRALFLQLLRDGFGLAVLLAATENELRSESDSEQRQRQDLERLNEQRNRDRVIASDPELLRHQSVHELETTNIARRRPQDQADVDSKKTGQTSCQRNVYAGGRRREIEAPQLTSPRQKGQHHRGEKSRTG